MRSPTNIVRHSMRAQQPLRGLASALRAKRKRREVIARREETSRSGLKRLVMAVVFALVLLASSRRAITQHELPHPEPHYPIVVQADRAQNWTEGSYEVWVLSGNCKLEQGNSRASAAEAVLWVDRGGALGDPPHKIIAYLEGDVAIEHLAEPRESATPQSVAKPPAAGQTPAVLARLEDKQWFGRLYSTSAPQIQIANPEPMPAVKPGIYNRALARRSPRPDALQRTQFESVAPGEALPVQGTRRIRAFPRSDMPVQAQWFPNAATGEWVAVINSGVNIVIDGLEGFGSIDISTDRLVIWTASNQEPDLTGASGQNAGTPLELYMEGNIVFREGDRIIQAPAMYYNVTQRNGVILQGEVLTPVPRYQGLVRLKADVLRQVDRDRFVAQGGSITTSRLGVPTYEFKSGTLVFEDNQTPAVNPFTGQIEVDETGQPIVQHQQRISSQNNVITVEQVPVFYWPFFAADLQRPPLYIKGLTYQNDRVFGNQVLVDFDPYQLFGIQNPPVGTDWTISLDYLSKRGFGAGTLFQYDREGVFDWPGRYRGFVDAWYLNDDGLDNLGLGRRALTFPESFRGRTLIQHRNNFANDWQLQFEGSHVSDRNFLEQYYEQEWDEQKNQITRLGVWRNWDNQALSIDASAITNDFFTENQDLPRLDHYWLGQSFLNDALTLYSHSSIGYIKQNRVTEPTDPTDLAQFNYLPYDANTQAERIASRNATEYPIQLGAVKVVPFALGELAHWGEDLNGDDVQRAYGQVGVKASMPMVSYNPTVDSTLWNVHGLAHKVVFDVEFSYTDANENLDELPIIDQIDDNNIQALRRRLEFEIYNGGPVPPQFDERFYAVRRGTMGWATGPTEIADDLTAIRLGARQRWQTKRGFPGQRRIIDWIVLDTQMELFPDADENFDSVAGLLDYDFRWHVGDRLTLLSFGAFDFFDEGQAWTTTGGYITRPPRGSLYLGVNTFEGNISSTVITSSYTYRMTPKWLSTFGTSFDVKSQGNIGQNFRLTRIGESFLFTVGFNVDVSRDNVGVNFAIVPRFLGTSRGGGFGSAGIAGVRGIEVPPAGLYGLE